MLQCHDKNATLFYLDYYVESPFPLLKLSRIRIHKGSVICCAGEKAPARRRDSTQHPQAKEITRSKRQDQIKNQARVIRVRNLGDGLIGPPSERYIPATPFPYILKFDSCVSKTLGPCALCF